MKNRILLLVVFVTIRFFASADCCGTAEYDPGSEECCNGTVVPYGRCCGGVVLSANQDCCLAPDTPYNTSTQCCTDDCSVVSKKVSYNELTTCCPDRKHDPNHQSTSNGCSAPVIGDTPPGSGVSFKPACDDHDICYGECNKAKSDCDTMFWGSMLGICDTSFPNSPVKRSACKLWADTYYNAVVAFGGSAYQSAQEEDCICCD